MRSREELNNLINQAFLIVQNEVGYIVDGVSPDEEKIYTHAEDDGEEFVFDYNDITDDDLIYGLQILNPA